MTDTQELRACPNPWCKSAEAYVRMIPCGDEVEHEVICPKCGISGPRGSYEDHAVQQWNTRASDGEDAIRAAEGKIINDLTGRVLRHESTIRAFERALGFEVDGTCPICGGIEGCSDTLKERIDHALNTRAGDGVGEAAQRLQDHMEQHHGVCLKASEWDSAVVATLSTNETAKLREALAPFANFADDRAPADMQITQGSRFAKRQLTMGDCQKARKALAGDA